MRFWAEWRGLADEVLRGGGGRHKYMCIPKTVELKQLQSLTGVDWTGLTL